MDHVYWFLAMGVDVTHATVMILWAAGLPLLIWHHFARLSRAYTWFAAAFVIASVTSQWLLGECILTRVARDLWLRSGDFRTGVPFTVLVVNAVAGFRPTSRTAVLLWETAVLATSAGSLWSFYRHARRERSLDRARRSAPRDREAC